MIQHWYYKRSNDTEKKNAFRYKILSEYVLWYKIQDRIESLNVSKIHVSVILPKPVYRIDM